MIRQKYSNGRWIGLTLSECPGCLSYFHFAPFLFVMALLGCSVLAFLGLPLFLYILLIIYGMFDIVNAVGCCTMKNVQPQFVFLPFIFPLLHVAYGIGTIVGLIQIPSWRKKIKNSGAKEQKYTHFYKRGRSCRLCREGKTAQSTKRTSSIVLQKRQIQHVPF